MSKGNKILVTGGCGFIGSHLVDKLIEKGHEVAVIDNLKTGKKENLNETAEFYKLNLAEDNLKEVFKKEKPDIIYHLAAQINARRSAEEPTFDARTNIIGGLKLLENALKLNTQPKLVFASSGGCVYGEPDEFPTPEEHPTEPDSPYGVAKLAFEKYLGSYQKSDDLDWLSLRLGNVYGPRQNTEAEAGVIAIFIENMLKGERCDIFGDGKQTRDYVYVDDVVDAFIKAKNIESKNWKRKKRAINIGTEKEASVNEIYKLTKEAVAKAEGKEGDIPEPVYKKPRAGDIRRSVLKNKKAANLLDWQPETDLQSGIEATVNWFSQHTTTQ
jgi:UDP-glucose 4-epimerase